VQPTFDHAWHARALQGDVTAIQGLADYAIAPLFAFCLYRVGGDRHLCEEVVQDTLVAALERLADYDPGRAEGEVWGWLVGLALNRVRKALADRKAVSLEALWSRMDRELLARYARLDHEPIAETDLVREETRQLVGAAMSQLPPRQRSALEAKYLEGRTTKDIARGLAQSEKAIESLLARARDAFRTAFLALTRSLEHPHASHRGA